MHVYVCVNRCKWAQKLGLPLTDIDKCNCSLTDCYQSNVINSVLLSTIVKQIFNASPFK